MVSSSVYGIEDFLNQVYAVLEGYDYTVWMSHKGTIPTSSHGTAFDNCLEAVAQCDAFLGIITGNYGSGVASGDISITHQELLKAIELDKLRWFLVHHDIAVARQLLKQFRFKKDGSRKKLKFKKTSVLSDIRVLDMYESAIRQDLPLSHRTGNWVQPYNSVDDALRFIKTQFEDPERLRKLLQESNG
jgi:hypothetical protein